MTVRILVPVKRVVDPNVRVRVSAAGAIETAGLKMSLNPFDECALEKALQLKEAGVASHVTVLTCGLPAHQDVLRTALAMGADDAVLIDTGAATATLDSLAVARLLAAHMKEAEYGLVLCGKQAIDGDVGGVAAMLAALLGWPQALNASGLDAIDGGWRASCGDDAGTATWQLDGPAVVSADLRLAEPRRVTLPSIVKAKQKPLATREAASLGGVSNARSHVLKLNDPPVREPGVKVDDVGALIAALADRRVFESVGV
ncbi:electron transfer flavoprotein subunit beta/FixA family protein [Paraburkholderia sp. CNPSo 3281]|uniref:electron transfer flavoprotein subunit beta/FixA family protein n=1 Tax=Paraburkholderia sp. CNPSo 3281 TaxID=2940933 RepID=UPI0020B694EB|nr:electron transfer flavoprotein subunit beta/FixA family protein [Paraburkholderia sp. CNPSo 3281]MCP3716382.1 electron transfer flavoprotein subunit beta/FixA family protein [Paraburkholderia sp. CNPSo 3281]